MKSVKCMTVCNEKQAKTLRERQREIMKGKQRRKKELVSTIATTIISTFLLVGCVCTVYNSDYTYWTKEGYVTEAMCRVVKVSDDSITVKHNGELYDFYGNGFSVGQRVECKFKHTTEMQLVNVK